MPATAAAQQMYTAAMARGMNEDFSIMIQFMEELAGLPQFQKNNRENRIKYTQFGSNSPAHLEVNEPKTGEAESLSHINK